MGYQALVGERVVTLVNAIEVILSFLARSGE